MPRTKKLSPIEIARIRAALPYLLRRIAVPESLIAAVAPKTNPPKIKKRDLRRLAEALASGPVVLEMHGTRLAITPKRGSGRPSGTRLTGSRKGRRGTDSRGHAMSAKRRVAMQWQGRYLGSVARLTAAQKLKVKRVKLADGYASAIRLAVALRRQGA